MNSDTNSDVNKTNAAQINSANGNEQKTDGKKEPFRLIKRMKSLILLLTVEPFLVCYIIPTILSSTAMQKFNMEKACRVDLNQTEEVCRKVVEGIQDDNTTIEALKKASVLVADMTAWREPITFGIPALMILFVGAWSDKTGNRKYLLLIPVIGEIGSLVGILAGTYFFLEWPLWVMALIEASSSTFTGGLYVILMGSYSYLADVTTPESRTFRMGVAGVLVSLGSPLANAISGILTVNLGYFGIFGISLAMYMFCFFYALIRIQDVRRVEIEGSFFHKLISFFHPKNVWGTLSLVFTSRGKQLLKITLVICAHIVIQGPVAGEQACLYLYTLNRYQMGLVDQSLYTTFALIMGLVGTSLAMGIFVKWLKVHDGLLGIIATTSNLLSTLTSGLAPTREYFFAGPVLGIFGGPASTAVRSLGTKIVQPDQVGKMCSLIGFVEALLPVIYMPLYTKIYSNTINTFPGAFYIVGAIMTVPDIIIFGSFYIMHRRQQRDAVTHPEVKEMHVYENDVTAF
ncbi:proton-coupled folate transporter-like [Ostrinia furnacalis]|uniref:proton-coupled folate transporter-like n=1 Tax=Ostrinia furnacalis TaxID=93504 RepID=UPI001040E057|nr:proton-coupled folate transporter-like [Ostrinia furnacalis]